MKSPIQLAQLATTPLAGRSGFWRGDTTLPPDIAAQAARRLGLTAFVYAATYTVAVLAGDVTIFLGHTFPDFWFDNVAMLVAIAISLPIFLLSRRCAGTGGFSPNTMLKIGLVYEVVGSFVIVFPQHWTPYLNEISPRGISWLVVWIALFPVIVPTTPRKTLIASFISASMSPLAYGISLLRGNPSPTPAFLFLLFYPCYLAAGLALVPSLVLAKLARSVKEARELGAYRLVRPLGHGGMGEVWRAEHRMLARPAAIKLIRPETLGVNGNGETALRRFEREAQVTAGLTSPHTVNLYDFGLTDEGNLYYAMELLDGLDLETLVERYGPQPAERVVHFLTQACRSLAEAHQRELIHRDIKPANLYSCRLGLEHDFVKLLDFGLVKSAHQEADGRLTHNGQVTGTPAYLAPEVATGVGPIDHRVDLYGLGCVGYWLLTGGLVFEGETPVQLVLHHVNTPPTPPSRRTELLIPPELDAIILACLEKDPNARPSSAGALASRLEACPLPARWTEERARAWWELHLPVET